MKRYLIFIIVIQMFINISCNRKSLVDTQTLQLIKNPKTNEIALDFNENENSNKITAISEKQVDTNRLNLLSKYDADFNGDGKNESIELYTDAMDNQYNVPMWDDRNRWILLVRDNKYIYLLSNEYIQFGEIKFWINKNEFQNIAQITEAFLAESNIEIFEYKFDTKEKVFIREKIFEKHLNGSGYYSPY